MYFGTSPRGTAWGLTYEDIFNHPKENGIPDVTEFLFNTGKPLNSSNYKF